MTTRDDAQMRTTEEVRNLAANLHARREYTDTEMDFFELVEDVLRGIDDNVWSDGPETAMLAWMRKHYDAQSDNDGQTVIYLGDGRDDYSDRCPSCNEPYEVIVEDGADCLECVVGRIDPDE